MGKQNVGKDAGTSHLLSSLVSKNQYGYLHFWWSSATMGDPTAMKTTDFWESDKGKVIKALVLRGATTWKTIQSETGLSSRSLNAALRELYDIKAISKSEDGDYATGMRLREECKNRNRREKHNMIVARIRRLHPDLSLDNRHAFLVQRDLETLSRYIVGLATHRVYAINPFVRKCRLSEKLVEASHKTVQVILVARRPLKDDNSYACDLEYHRSLKRAGVRMVYRKEVHAKVFVVDSMVAVVSSMNLYSASTEGRSWEAGIVSMDPEVVEAARTAFLKLLKSKLSA